MTDLYLNLPAGTYHFDLDGEMLIFPVVLEPVRESLTITTPKGDVITVHLGARDGGPADG